MCGPRGRFYFLGECVARGGGAGAEALIGSDSAHATQAEKALARHPGSTLEVGTWVALSDCYQDCGNAVEGPLQPGQIGMVVKQGPWSRVKVRWRQRAAVGHGMCGFIVPSRQNRYKLRACCPCMTGEAARTWPRLVVRLGRLEEGTASGRSAAPLIGGDQVADGCPANLPDAQEPLATMSSLQAGREESGALFSAAASAPAGITVGSLVQVVQGYHGEEGEYCPDCHLISSSPL